jgi:hypothetical protein
VETPCVTDQEVADGLGLGHQVPNRGQQPADWLDVPAVKQIRAAQCEQL